MAREYGRVWLSIWSDFEFRQLDVHTQWLYLALVSQPGMSTCGVLSYAPNRWSGLAEGLTARQVERSVARLEAARLIVVDRETDELLIRTHIRYDKPLRTVNTAKAVARTWAQIVSPEIQKVVLTELQRLSDENEFPEWLGWDVPDIQRLLQMPVRKAV